MRAQNNSAQDSQQMDQKQAIKEAVELAWSLSSAAVKGKILPLIKATGCEQWAVSVQDKDLVIDTGTADLGRVRSPYDKARELADDEKVVLAIGDILKKVWKENRASASQSSEHAS